jgi:hypothetical protein
MTTHINAYSEKIGKFNPLSTNRLPAESECHARTNVRLSGVKRTWRELPLLPLMTRLRHNSHRPGNVRIASVVGELFHCG